MGSLGAPRVARVSVKNGVGCEGNCENGVGLWKCVSGWEWVKGGGRSDWVWGMVGRQRREDPVCAHSRSPSRVESEVVAVCF